MLSAKHIQIFALSFFMVSNKTDYVSVCCYSQIVRTNGDSNEEKKQPYNLQIYETQNPISLFYQDREVNEIFSYNRQRIY